MICHTQLYITHLKNKQCLWKYTSIMTLPVGLDLFIVGNHHPLISYSWLPCIDQSIPLQWRHKIQLLQMCNIAYQHLLSNPRDIRKKLLHIFCKHVVPFFNGIHFWLPNTPLWPKIDKNRRNRFDTKWTCPLWALWANVPILSIYYDLWPWHT